jgi:type VI secretion system protein ImpH
MAAESRLQSAAVAGGAALTEIDVPAAAEPPGNGRAYLPELEKALRESATSFEFFQAVRTLERLHPDRMPPGRFADPQREYVRFTVNPSIAFPPQEIHSLELRDDAPARMSVNFFGLTGPLGVLPHHYTLLVAERRRARDHAPGDFFDLFHHRLISLFYRAWEKNRFTVGFEEQRDDRVTNHLLDLIGQTLDMKRGEGSAREALPFYVGLLGPQPRGAIALQQLLEDMFDVAVEVVQFIGGWYPLARRDQCSLGEDPSPSAQLGFGAVAGDEVWDQQTRVRLRVGPMSAARYKEFLPNGSAHEKLRWLVRYFSRDSFDFELQLVLDRQDVRGFKLGDDDALQPLGWSSWIKTAPGFARDADDTVVRL